jgi:hypothetical protein
MQMKPMGMRDVSAMLLASGLALVLAACSVLPRSKPVIIDRYTLDIPAWHVQAAGADAPVLLVTRPLARVDLDTPRMAYREQDYQLQLFRAQPLGRYPDAAAAAGTGGGTGGQRAFRGGGAGGFGGAAGPAPGCGIAGVQPGFPGRAERIPAAPAPAAGGPGNA